MLLACSLHSRQMSVIRIRNTSRQPEDATLKLKQKDLLMSYNSMLCSRGPAKLYCCLFGVRVGGGSVISMPL